MAAIALLGAALYGVSTASADSAPHDPRASLIQKLADTFHLDKTKVQAVFDQDQADRPKNRQTSYESRLTQAVTNGKLTSAQKDAILLEHNALVAKLDAARDQTAPARRAAMAAVWQEAKTWAANHDIEARWLMIERPHLRGGHGPGMAGEGTINSEN